MTDEATPKGVSESEAGFGADRLAKINAIHDDRAAEREDDDSADDAMAQLAKQAEALDDELAQYDDGEDPDKEPETETDTPPEDKDTSEDETDTEAGTDTDTETDADEPEPPVFFENGQWMTRIKVDGEIKTIPFAKVHAAAQKLDAGDKRLEEANRLMRDIEEREQRLLNAGQSTDQPPAQGADGQGQPETGQLNQETRQLTAQYHEALLAGDDDKANELLEQLTTAGRQQPQVDVDAIAAKVRSQVAQETAEKEAQKQEAERKETLRKAYATFSTEFKDIVEDEALTKVADQFTTTVAQEHPTYSPLEVMREAGKRTRKWLEAKTGTNPRVERKRNLKTASGTGARQPGKPEEKPPTRTDQLNEIRQARGQEPIG